MRALALFSSLLIAAAVGCSGSSKKDAKDPDSKWDMSEVEPDPQPQSDSKPQSDPDPDSGDDDDDEPAPKPKPLTQDDDYEINHRDCDALAQAYGRAWKRDEMDKLHKKNLPKPKFDKMEEELSGHAEEMKDNWRSECYKTVGTAYLRTRLKCAIKAKGLKRFNDCMDGLADE